MTEQQFAYFIERLVFHLAQFDEHKVALAIKLAADDLKNASPLPSDS